MNKKNKKILVVDDDDSIVESIKAILETEGYTVITASTNISLQRRFKQDNPDLVILDILLSGTDGREIAYFLQNETGEKTPPIIMMSALPYAEETAMTAGAIAFLPKPFEITDLLKLVEKHLKLNSN